MPLARRVHLLSLLYEGGCRQRTVTLPISWCHLIRWWYLRIASHNLGTAGLLDWGFCISCQGWGDFLLLLGELSPLLWLWNWTVLLLDASMTQITNWELPHMTRINRLLGKLLLLNLTALSRAMSIPRCWVLSWRQHWGLVLLLLLAWSQGS